MPTVVLDFEIENKNIKEMENHFDDFFNRNERSDLNVDSVISERNMVNINNSC
jgi:hypothetical protein